MRLNTSCFASSLVLRPLPFTSSRLSVLKKDSASALSHGLPGRDMDWAIPWGSRRRWSAREAYGEPWSSRKTRLKSPGALPSDCLPERIRDRLLGHAPGHRPAHDLPAERVDRGCEAGPSLARSDVADPPYCGDRKALKDCNDPRTTHPKIAREWNRERNGDLKPTDVIAGSNKRVWWKCEEGHEWSGLIANRARKGKADPGCPYCSGRKVPAGYNDLAATHPGIAAMWHPRMNRRLKPTGVQTVSRKPAWWRGECGRVYQMAVRDRARAKPGYCPYCSGRKRPERPIRLD